MSGAKKPNQVLASVAVIDCLPRGREVVCLNSEAPLEKAMEVLNEHHFISAPVLEGGDAGKFYDFLDVLDCCSFLLTCFPHDVDSVTEESLKQFVESGETFAKATVKTVVDAARGLSLIEGRRVWPVKLETSLDKVFDLFWMGIHRVPVIESTGRITTVLTQSDVIAFLAQNIHILGESRWRTLEELSVSAVVDKVEAASMDELTIKAVHRLYAKQVSAIPVVDSEGRLVANLSASDLRYLRRSNMTDLMLPLYKFLCLRRALSKRYVSIDNDKSLHPLTARLSDTLESAIFKLAATRVHRLWLVDDEFKPIGAISLTDCMRAW
eukprot:CAMPEP_0177649098 /NCGR_PEP_ID=MMETSP0447-20121125/11186_1 /TAXON_ID=0 /ORGANISM="Stygamoeba regulata, Strain BSH-02190019" /LENGTH=323 /DNA_ID=CAMNT_0019151795 /DNA_START=56 /DNA_END=1027 /DNA_ORIENTATION=+